MPLVAGLAAAHFLGSNHFDQRAKGKQVLRVVNRLQNLGYAVEITPRAA